jgi:acyl carrier protein
MSVNWGALTGAGMAVSGPEIAEHLARIGLNSLNPMEACSALGWALERDDAQLAFADIDWKRWRQAYPATAGLPCFTYVTGASASESDAPAQKLRAELLAAQPEERSNIVAGIIAEFVAEIMRLPIERVGTSEPLSDMGLDSIMGVELQVNVNTKFGVDVPVLLLAKGENIIAVSKEILVRMGVEHAHGAE